MADSARRARSSRLSRTAASWAETSFGLKAAISASRPPSGVTPLRSTSASDATRFAMTVAYRASRTDQTHHGPRNVSQSILHPELDPSRPGDDGAIVRLVAIGIADRRIEPFSGKGPVLGVDPDALLVPEDDLVAGVAGQVGHGGGQVGMAVVGKHHDSTEPTVDQAALARIPREQDEFLAVAAPVDRQHRAARVDRLVLGQEVAVGIEQSDDPGVLPEVDAHELEARQVGAVSAHAGALGMS